MFMIGCGGGNEHVQERKRYQGDVGQADGRWAMLVTRVRREEGYRTKDKGEVLDDWLDGYLS